MVELIPDPEGSEFLLSTDADADSGESTKQFILNKKPAEVEAMERANRHLKTRGGRGDPGVALVDGTVMTVGETIAVTIAKDMIDDCIRRHGKKLEELTLLELNHGIEARVKGRATNAAQVGAEICRLQNKAIYGNVVRRR